MVFRRKSLRFLLPPHPYFQYNHCPDGLPIQHLHHHGLTLWISFQSHIPPANQSDDIIIIELRNRSIWYLDCQSDSVGFQFRSLLGSPSPQTKFYLCWLLFSKCTSCSITIYLAHNLTLLTLLQVLALTCPTRFFHIFMIWLQHTHMED